MRNMGTLREGSDISDIIYLDESGFFALNPGRRLTSMFQPFDFLPFQILLSRLV